MIRLDTRERKLYRDDVVIDSWNASYFKVNHECTALKFYHGILMEFSTKLEKIRVSNFLYQYDVIGLNEVKTNPRISFPGYVSYKSSVSGGGQRDGKVVLVRRALHLAVLAMDTSAADQVWLRLDCLQGVLLGFV